VERKEKKKKKKDEFPMMVKANGYVGKISRTIHQGRVKYQPICQLFRRIYLPIKDLVCV